MTEAIDEKNGTSIQLEDKFKEKWSMPTQIVN